MMNFSVLSSILLARTRYWQPNGNLSKNLSIGRNIKKSRKNKQIMDEPISTPLLSNLAFDAGKFSLRFGQRQFSS